ncbi:hypothetical protein DFH09DRAFT_1089901 [Mycena vulgaris]|nr:hypothetical protein DFH09DRAFT_1089901 [Mycena vulgaris]
MDPQISQRCRTVEGNRHPAPERTAQDNTGIRSIEDEPSQRDGWRKNGIGRRLRFLPNPEKEIACLSPPHLLSSRSPTESVERRRLAGLDAKEHYESGMRSSNNALSPSSGEWRAKAVAAAHRDHEGLDARGYSTAFSHTTHPTRDDAAETVTRAHRRNPKPMKYMGVLVPVRADVADAAPSPIYGACCADAAAASPLLLSPFPSSSCPPSIALSLTPAPQPGPYEHIGAAMITTQKMQYSPPTSPRTPVPVRMEDRRTRPRYSPRRAAPRILRACTQARRAVVRTSSTAEGDERRRRARFGEDRVLCADVHVRQRGATPCASPSLQQRACLQLGRVEGGHLGGCLCAGAGTRSAGVVVYGARTAGKAACAPSDVAVCVMPFGDGDRVVRGDGVALSVGDNWRGAGGDCPHMLGAGWGTHFTVLAAVLAAEAYAHVRRVTLLCSPPRVVLLCGVDAVWRRVVRGGVRLFAARVRGASGRSTCGSPARGGDAVLAAALSRRSCGQAEAADCACEAGARAAAAAAEETIVCARMGPWWRVLVRVPRGVFPWTGGRRVIVPQVAPPPFALRSIAEGGGPLRGGVLVYVHASGRRARGNAGVRRRSTSARIHKGGTCTCPGVEGQWTSWASAMLARAAGMSMLSATTERGYTAGGCGTRIMLSELCTDGEARGLAHPPSGCRMW